MTSISIGGNLYDVYGTTIAADAYLAGSFRLASAWAALSSDRRKAALVEVARALNVKQWRGDKVSDVQALAWPRTGTFGSPPTAQVNVTPQIVIDASYLMAGLLAKNPGLLGTGNAQAPLQSLREGPTAATFYFASREGGIGSVDEIDAMLAAYLGADDASLGALMVGQVCGTDGLTAFSEDNALEIS